MTKEVDFFDEFPSLKGKVFSDKEKERWVHIEDIKGTCKDNKRIKEVIKNMIDDAKKEQIFEDKAKERINTLTLLLRELGL